MEDNLIFVPYADVSGMVGGYIKTKNENERRSMYLKNACVALVSAKHFNPNDTVALITNLKPEEIDDEQRSVLTANEIEIRTVPFDSFLFESDYTWSLAFYKLCALKAASQMGYRRLCYMDTDVYVQGSFAPIWMEADHHMMLLDTEDGLLDERFFREAESFCPGSYCVTHYGGEFFAATSEQAIRFLEELNRVFCSMRRQKTQVSTGDEFILSIAAEQFRGEIKNVAAYVFRFSTGTYRNINERYYGKNMLVLHVPLEKKRGMIALYERWIKCGKLPSRKRVWWELYLTRQALSDRIKRVVKWILEKYRMERAK